MESTQIKICEAVLRAKPPRTNVSKDEVRAMKELWQDKDIKILKADQGSATVILDAEDYEAKVHDLLDDGKLYSVLKKDPTRTTEKKILTLLRDMTKRGKISEAFYNSVRPSEGSSKPARFYGTLKLHNESTPQRPVNATGHLHTYLHKSWQRL